MKNLRALGAMDIDLGREIPSEAAGDFLAKAYYVVDGVENITYASGSLRKIRVEFHANPRWAETETPAKFAALAAKFCEAYRPAELKVIGSRKTNKGGPNPESALLQAGDLVFYGRGRLGLGPQLTKLFRLLDGDVVTMSQDFAAVPYQFPSLIGADTLLKCNYLAHFPHSLNLVVNLREDTEGISNFASQAHWKGDHLDYPQKSLGDTRCLLSPSVCFHWYEALSGKPMATPQSATAIGKCFRYESGRLAGLDRLWDFSMREIIFAGPQPYVLGQSQRIIGAYQELLAKWDLDYEIRSATDPFFIDLMQTQTTFQAAFDLKFEVQATIPYAKSSIAVSSFNYHMDTLGRAFQLADSEGHIAHTGCFAVGMERLVWAFVCQHGTDPAKWPEGVRKRLS